MKLFLTALAGANFIALNLFVFFKIPAIPEESMSSAIAIVVIYIAGFIGSAAASVLHRN